MKDQKIQTTDAGNGNPPPNEEQNIAAEQPVESIEQEELSTTNFAGNGNPPPKDKNG